MITSARNQFNGSITAIHKGAVNDEIELSIGHGLTIYAMVTHASSARLAVKEGVDAVALVKASSIVLVPAPSAFEFSARNQLTGVIAEIKTGAVNTEVHVLLANEVAAVAIITNESCNSLALASGKQVTAMFKSSSVILGIAKH